MCNSGFVRYRRQHNSLRFEIFSLCFAVFLCLCVLYIQCRVYRTTPAILHMQKHLAEEAWTIPSSPPVDVLGNTVQCKQFQHV